MEFFAQSIALPMLPERMYTSEAEIRTLQSGRSAVRINSGGLLVRPTHTPWEPRNRVAGLVLRFSASIPDPESTGMILHRQRSEITVPLPSYWPIPGPRTSLIDSFLRRKNAKAKAVRVSAARRLGGTIFPSAKYWCSWGAASMRDFDARAILDG